jgi:hypothetical protein
MTTAEIAAIAARYGATVNKNVTVTRCRPQRRWKYGFHSTYMPARWH